MIATCGSRRARPSKPCHFFQVQLDLQPGCNAIVSGGRSNMRPEVMANGSGKGPSHPIAPAIFSTDRVSPDASHSVCEKACCCFALTQRESGALQVVKLANA